tara:strand:- start:5683 stop:6042 length:360 start_codon:yes stop_codon:yes gene_type:complete
MKVFARLLSSLKMKNTGYKYLTPVQVKHVRTHLPNTDDVAHTLARHGDCSYIPVVQGEAAVLSAWLETSRVLRENENLRAFSDFNIHCYAWYMMTDMSMYNYIRVKEVSYAHNFPFITR